MTQSMTRTVVTYKFAARCCENFWLCGFLEGKGGKRGREGKERDREKGRGKGKEEGKGKGSFFPPPAGWGATEFIQINCVCAPAIGGGEQFSEK